MSGVSTPPTLAPEPSWRRPGRWIGAGLLAEARGLALFALALVGLIPVAGLALGLDLLVNFGGATVDNGLDRRLLGLVVMLAGAAVVRWQAGLTRRLAGQWCGVAIAVPYRQVPPGAAAGPWQHRALRVRVVLADPATWRDLLWAVVNACGGWLLALFPALLTVGGVFVLLRGGLGVGLASHPLAMPKPLPRGIPGPGNRGSVTLVLAGAALAVAGVWIAPHALRGYGRFAAALLGPTSKAELALQVRHLARTRSDAIDSGAAAMRRIERDLHDGAQARLVAMGMTLQVAEQLLDSDPAAARALLAEARTSSARALAELRNLVRGIHPPVLADRGLAEAVRALALDSPVRAQLAGDLAGRPPAPVESAAYFAVSELLANVSKHAAAARVWIDIGHEHGMLRIGVTDDGRGGADPARGTGLAGIERRIAAFDGVVAVSSPMGGPTVVNMEIPCALSSPKTSSC